MEATVAERGQITLPKAVRDALGLTKGSILKVELETAGSSCARASTTPFPAPAARFKLDGFESTDEAMRAIRGRAPGDPLDP